MESKIIDLNQRLLDNFIEKHRPPVELRDQLDYGYAIEGRVVRIFEIRPFWLDQSEIIESAVARAKFVKSRSVWKVYWMRADLKWHPYDPQREVSSLAAFLELVEEDKYGCFWG